MKVTEVRVRKNERILGNSQRRGIASITLDNEIAINGIWIIEGAKGLRLSFPTQRINNPNAPKGVIYRNTAFPVNNEARDKITKAVLEEYNKPTEKEVQAD